MLVITNWKMNPLSLSQAYKLLDFYQKLNYKIWVAPPFLFLQDLIKKYPDFIFGVQNIYFEKRGAYTGEISPWMVKNIGGKFTIINHSERRKLKEDLKIANLKLKSALKANLISVVCFGEDNIIKDKQSLIKEWNKEYKILFRDLNINSFKNKIIIVYEPSWAISTAKIGPVPKEQVVLFINWIKKRFRGKILYGGSVFPENIENYLNISLDGFLIGSHSLKPKNFRIIIEKIKKFSIIK